MERLPQATSEIARKVGKFFATTLPSTTEARKMIERLGVQQMAITKNGLKPVLKISLSRPGLLIGPKGKTIEALEKYIGMKILVEEADSITDHMLLACWDIAELTDADLGLE